MAITHSIVHSYPGPATPAGKMLEFVNRKLADRYTGDRGSFVTAFYGIYDPARRRLTYASAGHPPPRLKRCGQQQVLPVSCEPGLPLGIDADESYCDCDLELIAGDSVCSIPTASPRRWTMPVRCTARPGWTAASKAASPPAT